MHSWGSGRPRTVSRRPFRVYVSVAHAGHMHRKARVSAQLRSVQQNQDWVVSREQALAYGLTRGRMPLPWHKGSRHRRGRRPGGDSLGSTARSHRFVKMRRTVRPFAVVCTDRLRYLAAPDAVIAACRLMTQDRSVVAALSEAVQRRCAATHRHTVGVAGCSRCRPAAKVNKDRTGLRACRGRHPVSARSGCAPDPRGERGSPHTGAQLPAPVAQWSVDQPGRVDR